MHYALSADEFSHALDMVKKSVVILNDDGQILWANKKTKTLFNFNSQELKDKEFARLITSSQGQPNNCDLTHFLAENNLLQYNDAKEVICYQKNGTPFSCAFIFKQNKNQ